MRRLVECTGSNIRRVAKRLNISIVKRRSINANETFNKGKKLVTRVCLNCGKELSNHNSTTKYCNNVCQAEYKHKEYILPTTQKTIYSYCVQIVTA